MDQCQNCEHFIPRPNLALAITEKSRCFLHGVDDTIAAPGWCKHHKPGRPGRSGFRPQGLVTKAQSSYVDDARKSMNLGQGRKP